MRFTHRVLACACSLATITAGSVLATMPAVSAAEPVRGFAPVATHYVSEGIAEIVSASPNGKTLVYTNSEAGRLGFVDITNPATPTELGVLDVGGEPTSVDIMNNGTYAIAGVQYGDEVAYDAAIVVDVASRTVVREIQIPKGPDSVVISPNGRYAAIAIEAEPGDGEELGSSRPGQLVIIDLVGWSNPAAWGVRIVDFPSDPDMRFPLDPEPEYITITDDNVAAVTLQENNAVAFVKLFTGQVLDIVTTGETGPRDADLTADGVISFTETMSGRREPDGIAYLDDGRYVTANEGDVDPSDGLASGGRGFTVWNANHTVSYDTRANLEQQAVLWGHYDDTRSTARGIEVENVATGTIQGTEYIFANAERGKFMAVYRILPDGTPKFTQLLPTGVEPEGVTVIENRDLVVTANEGDGTLSIFGWINSNEYGTMTAPRVQSQAIADRQPTDFRPWGALSGLVNAGGANTWWTVSDSFFAEGKIFRMKVGTPGRAVLDQQITVGESAPVAGTTLGSAANRWDLEGIAVAPDDDFWVASEGNGAAGAAYKPNLLAKVAADGTVVEQLELPATLQSCHLAQATAGAGASNIASGLEGVALSTDGSKLYTIIQRPWMFTVADNGAGFDCTTLNLPAGQTRVLTYDFASETWSDAPYALDTDQVSGGSVGLSEITTTDAGMMIIERDNQLNLNTRVKRLYLIDPAAAAEDGSPLPKRLVRDLLAQDGQRIEKWEGAGVTPGGRVWVLSDNDGSGETRFRDLGKILPTVDTTLTLLHNNDGESKLTNAGTGVEDFGGVARFTTVVKVLREEAEADGETVVTLSSGDNFLAGPQFNASLLTGQDPYYDSLALNEVGYDAIAIGNHEFDFGPEVLSTFINGFEEEVPFLSSNLDVSADPFLGPLADDGLIAPSTVIERDGRKIGVVGATTPLLPALSSPGENVVIDPDVAGSIQAEIDEMTADGVEIIVVISHLQNVNEDKALAGLLSNVDVMIAGGGDELLANADSLLVPGDVYNPALPYPIRVTNADGAAVPIITTAGDYKYVGKFTADFDAAGNLLTVDAGSGPVRVAGGSQPDAVTPDAVVQSTVVDPVTDYVSELATTVVANSEVALEGRRDVVLPDTTRTGVRISETNLGNVFTDALLWAATEKAAEFGTPTPQVAIQNGGGIRNNTLIPAGPVTELNTFEIAAFANYVAIVPDVSAAQFKEILENAYSKVPLNDGRFAQISGFEVTIDTTQTAQVVTNEGVVTTPGSRIRSVVLDDGTVIIEDGAVVAGAPAIDVATIDFLVSQNGDQYPFNGASYTRLGLTYQQALSLYLSDELGGVVSAAQYPVGGNGRMTFLG